MVETERRFRIAPVIVGFALFALLILAIVGALYLLPEAGADVACGGG